MSRGASLPITGGAFVAVVGPSGSGKDSVMGYARAALADECRGRIHFAQRIITRAGGDGTEAHEACSFERFGALRDAGAFALSWEAHGCGYGIPVQVDDAVKRGDVVVANLSRSVLPEMRDRYLHAFAVEITAPVAVLARRIAARGRETGAAVEARLKRSERFCAPAIPYELVIDNSGPLDIGGAAFARFLRHCVLAEPAA